MTCLTSGQTLDAISGNIHVFPGDSIAFRTCPDYVDSCIFICSNGNTNPCHPEDLYPIAIDTSSSGETTPGSRYRIYFPWENEGETADKFTVTASWPCLSPTAVYASGDYAFWDLYGNDDCPGTVQGSIWYGDDCEDDYGNIGSDDCTELVGRFCFVPGDTMNWEYEADQSISTDICNACWMSSPAWEDYDSEMYSDSLLYPENCIIYDHCHHSEGDDVPCGIGYLDGQDTTSVSLMRDEITNAPNFFNNYPNPFNPRTTIQYDLKISGHIDIKVLDIKGATIVTLVSEHAIQGNYSTEWNGKDQYGNIVPAGMYFCVLRTVDDYFTKKLLLIK